jgi:DNA (cytosine-5)-methyltransferase 1
LKALDLYSGVGGWTLGLGMAGIETAAAYEWWAPAARTDARNTGANVHVENIRDLSLSTLPTGIDLVVGSPPCTQFSYSNRGGGGDIGDGLVDIRKFLEVVEKVQPKFWVMENVPRVAAILESELQPNGRLSKYRDLVDVIDIFDMSDYGIPQSRRRMLAGRFPAELLREYSTFAKVTTLGKVVQSLSAKTVVDPNYEISVPGDTITDHIFEEHLTPEELRRNREAKGFHPIYNVMKFPEDLERPARTITATETRVSRESLMVRSDGDEMYRRLSLRERATLQGFPVTFQFEGRYNDRLKMIGNAIPPLFTYLIAHSMLLTEPESAYPVVDRGGYLTRRIERLEDAIPPTLKKRYSEQRKFRAAIPNLRFGSGVRFDLSNSFNEAGEAHWSVVFHYGSSKNIGEIELTQNLMSSAIRELQDELFPKRLIPAFDVAEEQLQDFSSDAVQSTWTHQIDRLHPFRIVDILGDLASETYEALPEGDQGRLFEFVHARMSGDSKFGPRNSLSKIAHIDKWVFVGFIVGAWFNHVTNAPTGDALSWDEMTSEGSSMAHRAEMVSSSTR